MMQSWNSIEALLEAASVPADEAARAAAHRHWASLAHPLGSLGLLETMLEDGINSIGLGPQGMSGKLSVMGVHIENTARHPSTIGVAVNVGCWSHRRGHVIFDKDLNATVTTHSGVQL